jgi:hypothetical protein
MSNLDQPPSVQADYARAQLRRAVYWILIIASAGVMTGRIWSATILQSANDRSRWCTIRALVDNDTYEIDQLIYDADGKSTDWFTIDRVRHKDKEGDEHTYSSKPTLLPTLQAGQYWIIKNVTGANLDEHPQYVGRLMLLFSNVLPIVVFLLLLAVVAERYGTTDWGRMFVVACGAFGTMITTFAVTLNNHVPAAVSVMIAIYAALAIWRDGDRRWYLFALAGLFSAFAVANELPALAFVAVIALALLIKSPLPTLAFFVPAAAVVVFGFFYTNYRAHDTWKPAYAHRQDGAELFSLDKTASNELDKGNIPVDLLSKLKELPADDQRTITVGARVTESLAPDTIAPLWKFWADERKVVERRWRIVDPVSSDRLAVLQYEGEDAPSIHDSDNNWYDYEDSYWTDVRSERKSLVDQGEPSLGLYAFNVFIGHHGVFSLTPIWLLTVLGLLLMLFGGQRRMRGFALMVLAVSGVCILFYLVRPVSDRNYGGVCCGMRWLMWFTPMWLVCILPAADSMSHSRFWRAVGLILLFISIMSASYALLKPWVHPWIYEYWNSLGWRSLLHS